MNALISLLSEHCLLLLIGSTFLLGLGCVAVATCSSPVHRQRLAEVTVLGVLAWLVLALLPLPRLTFSFQDNDWHNRYLSAEAPRTSASAHEEPVALAEFGATTIPESDLPQLELSDLQVSALPAEADLRAFQTPEDLISSASVDERRSSEPVSTPAEDNRLLGSAETVRLIAGLYVLGGSACLAWLILGHLLLLRIRAKGEEPAGWLTNCYEDLRTTTGIQSATLLVSEHCSRPISWGILWPVIVLPRRLCCEQKRRLVATILLHELGHIARRDSLGNLLFGLASPILYCHPLYWWLRRDWILAAELLADDFAASQTGKESYIEELVDLARATNDRGLHLVGVTSVFSSPSQFYRRMQMLLIREQRLVSRTSARWQLASFFIAGIGIAIAASLAGVRPAIAQIKTTEGNEAPPALAEPSIEPARAVEPKPEEPKNAGVPTASEPPKTAKPQTIEGAPPSFKVDSQAQSAAIQQLRAEKAVLEAQLKALQARLKQLGAEQPANLDPAKRTPKLPENTKTITLTRVDPEGVVWNEIWTVDEQGLPKKLIQQEATTKLPLKTETKPTPDGKVLKAFRTEDGSVTVHVYDAATGKFIETRREGPGAQPLKLGVTPELPAPSASLPTSGFAPPPLATVPVEKPTPSITVAPQAGPPAGLPAGPLPAVTATAANPSMTTSSMTTSPVPERSPGSSGHRELDLLTLATSYADAVGDLEATQAKMADIDVLAKQSPTSVSKQEITSARLAVSAAQRKQQLLQRIATVALNRVTKELDRATQLHKTGNIPTSELEESQTRVEIIKQILSTQPSNDDSGLRK